MSEHESDRIRKIQWGATQAQCAAQAEEAAGDPDITVGVRENPVDRLRIYFLRDALAAIAAPNQTTDYGWWTEMARKALKNDELNGCVGGVRTATETTAPERDARTVQSTDTDSLGLSIDMLDADRLRQYAQNLLTYGPDITHWASVPHVVSKLQTIANGIENAVRDIGVLRQSTSPASPAATSADEIAVGLLQEVIDKSQPRKPGGQQVGAQRYQMTPSTRQELQRIVRRWREARLSAAERPAQTWQPIESVPKDGRRFIGLYGAFEPSAVTVFWDSRRGGWCGLNGFGLVEPKAWMPLPASPRSVVAPEKD